MSTPRPRADDFPGDPLGHRMAVEAWACTQECGMIGCTRPATHTWSGHPTCDHHAIGGRRPHPGGAARLTDTSTGETTFVLPDLDSTDLRLQHDRADLDDLPETS